MSQGIPGLTSFQALQKIDEAIKNHSPFENVEDIMFRVVHREPETGEFAIILLADDVYYFARRSSRMHYRSGQLRIRAGTVQDCVTLEIINKEVKTDG